MTSRRHVLYITAGFPFPLTSGYLRHRFLIEELAAEHDITLLSLVGRDFRPEHIEALRPFTRHIETFGPPARGRRAQLRARARQLALVPVDDSVRRLRSAVDRAVAGGAVDAVVLTGKRTSPALDVLGDVPLVVDLCDATSSRLRGEARHARPLRAADLTLQHVAMRRIERALVARADRLLVASERDRGLLAEAVGGERAAAVNGAVVVPNGVDVDRWSRRRPTLGSTVAFCGNLGYPPNADAARRLVVDVMPAVWARRPATRVVIVGRDPAPGLRAMSGPRVTVTGLVPDVRPFLEDAAVFAAPLRFGAGIQNKVLEAMAMEVPVVSSSSAADGLVVAGNRPPVAVADEPAAMADLVDARLAAAEGDPTPDRAARQWVGQRFGWRASGADLAAAVDDAIARREPVVLGAPC